MANANDIRRRLRNAVKTGEIVGIVYRGGAQSGAYREIMPLEVAERQVRARCQASGLAKTFDLDKIELRAEPPSQDDGISVWSLPAVPASDLKTIAEVETAHRAPLEALGWHVEVSRTEDGEFLTLHCKTKAGKPLKGWVHRLAFEPMTWDTSSTGEGGLVRTNIRPRARPWSAAGKTLGDASTAIGLFLAAAASGP